MALTEKQKIYQNVWCCAFRRRYDAQVSGKWDLYDREHETIRMTLEIAKWWKFDTEGKKFL